MYLQINENVPTEEGKRYKENVPVLIGRCAGNIGKRTVSIRKMLPFPVLAPFTTVPNQ
jgi:hypothetical protein